MSKYDELYQQLSDRVKEQCDQLMSNMRSLGVTEGMAKRILLYGNMGDTNQPRGVKIWQAVSYANTHHETMRRVKDKGAYIYQIARNGMTARSNRT